MKRRTVLVSALGLLAGVSPHAARAAEAAAAAEPARLATAAQLRAELQKLRGKIVLLNFWATWCTPCLKEIPDFLALEAEFAPQGLKLVGVSMNEPTELTSVVEPFRQKFFPTFATLLRNDPDMDTMASVVDPAWNEILPTSWLLGRDGKVLQKIQGRRSREEFRTLLRSAVAVR